MGSRGLGQLAYDKGMRVLAASQADDVAIESRSLRQGLLTYAIVRNGLQQKGAAFDGRITLGGLLRYGERHVPSLYQEVLAGEVKDASGIVDRNADPIPPATRRNTRSSAPTFLTRSAGVRDRCSSRTSDRRSLGWPSEACGRRPHASSKPSRRSGL